MHVSSFGPGVYSFMYAMTRGAQCGRAVEALSVCACRCQSLCDLSFQLEQDVACRNSEVSKLQQTVSDLQVYVQQEREHVLRLSAENDRLQVCLLSDSML